MPHYVEQLFLLKVSSPFGDVLKQETLTVSPLVHLIWTVDRWSKTSADES